MKRLMAAALAVGLLGLGARVARAHGDEAGKKEGGRGEFAAKMRERMKEKLELSDEQSKKLDAAFKAHEDAVKPLHEKQREAMKKLAGQVEAKASDKDLQASLDALDAGRKEMDEQRRKLEDSFASILTPLQRAKMRLAIGKRMQGRMHGRGGPRGGGRGDSAKDDEGDGD